MEEGGRKRRQGGGSGGFANQLNASQALQFCGTFAGQDDNEFMDINNLRDANGDSITRLPECPLTTDQLGINSHIFDPFPTQTGICYRSNSDNTFVPTDSSLMDTTIFVSVCCYDITSG